jgi:peptidoglycan/xylan/chitin deacetylase (PgdA/CDA1 family)
MGAKIVFTMDNLGDAADLYRGNIQAPRKRGENPAFDTGFPSLLNLFNRYEIPLTYFVEGWSAREYPDAIERILAQGAELGMHGWIHERWLEQSDAEVEDICQRAHTSILQASGLAPKVFRAPGGHSSAFTHNLLKTMGYDIDASITENESMSHDKDGFAYVSYQWLGVDASHWLWDQCSDETATAAFHRAITNAKEKQDYLVFIWHPHVMGLSKDRLAVGEQIIQTVLNDSELDVVSLRQLAFTN